MTELTSRSMVAASDADGVVDHISANCDIIVPLANGEPATLFDAIERHAESLSGVRVHQMHALRDRPYLHGVHGDHLRHVSYFLSHVTRPCFHAGTIGAHSRWGRSGCTTSSTKTPRSNCGRFGTSTTPA